MVPKILIVDDDPAFRNLLSGLLRTQGFEIVTAGDGQEALEEFSRCEADLVLLDVQMPRMDGFEVCRQLKPGFPL